MSDILGYDANGKPFREGDTVYAKDERLCFWDRGEALRVVTGCREDKSKATYPGILTRRLADYEKDWQHNGYRAYTFGSGTTLDSIVVDNPSPPPKIDLLSNAPRIIRNLENALEDEGYTFDEIMEIRNLP